MQQDTRSIPFPASRRAVTTGRLQRLFPAARMLAGLSRSLAGKPFPPFDVTLEDGTVHRFRPDETIRGDTVIGRPAGTPGASESTRIPGRAAGMTGLAETAGADNIPTSSARPPCRASDDPAFTLRIRNRDGLRALASLDELSIAEAYVGGNIDVEGEFLPVLDMRRFFSDRHPMRSIWRFIVPLIYGRVKADKTWVPRHYDNGNEFYFSFLDRERHMYSQALYRSEDETLAQAVDNKLAYITNICRLRPGARVLDVGGGWGSFGRYAAERGINVTMLTISHEQFAYLSELAAASTLPGRLEPVYESIFAYQSAEPFDAIVTLGVMEHLPDYRALFAQLRTLVKRGGRVYMDFSAIRRKFAISSFTYRYVFPGNHTPVYMPDLIAAGNEAPFELIAAQNDRHSYFLTLRDWARNLEAAHDELSCRFGEATYRLFRLYLWATAHCLHCDGSLESYRVVFQHAAGRESGEIGL